MSNRNRWIIEAVFLAIATVFALANDGWPLTRWAIIAFWVGILGYEIINYFVIRKRLKK